MRRHPTLVLLVVLLSGCSGTSYPSGSDGIGDTYYPQLGNGGYDAIHYTLELDVDPQSNALSGVCTVKAQATQSLGTFNLDFSGLTVEQVTVNGQIGEYRREERELTVTPSQPIADGAVFTVTITYRGSPESSRTLGGRFQAGWFHNNDDEIYVSSETSGAATWYPVNDHPLDKATYSFRIAVPKPYVVAATGLLVQEIDNGDTVTYVWEATEPMASYLAAVNIAEYVRETEQGPDGVLIRNYFPPGFPDASREGFEQTADMMAFFSDRFGPYPFGVYGSVIANIPGDFYAMETQTLSQHANTILARSESIIAHELAHQWFGNSVSLENWQDMWLKEGPATYAEWLWLEHREGAEALDARVRGAYYLEALSANAPGNPSQNNLFDITVYDRGALTLHTLRLRFGDEVFFQILRAYVERFRHANASTADFIAVAEEVSGQDLSEFFEAWLYTEEIPTIPEMDLEP